MKLKINFLNTLNYSLAVNGLEETSLKYSKIFKNNYPQDHTLYKTLTKIDQLITLANEKRQLNYSDKNMLLPIIHLNEKQIESNYLVDCYQAKQYIRIVSINELIKFLKTKKGYLRLINQIKSGDDGLDFKKYIDKSKAKQAVYIRDTKLIIVILNPFLIKKDIKFNPQQWDASFISEVIRLAINEAFNYYPVTDVKAIKIIANNYSNSKADKLRKEINENKNKEDKLLSSLRATFEQFNSINRL